MAYLKNSGAVVAPPRRKRSVRKAVLLSLVVGGACLGGLCVAIWQAGRTRLNRQLEALIASGAPMYPEDLRWSERSGAGPDPANWLAAFTILPSQDPQQYLDLNTELQNGGEADVQQIWLQAECKWRDPASTLSSTESMYLERRLQLDSILIAHAMEFARFGPILWREHLVGQDGDMRAVVSPTVLLGSMGLAEILCEGAYAAALDGDAGLAITRLNLALDAADLLGEAPSMPGFFAWARANERIVETWMVCLLRSIPQDSDLSVAQNYFARLDGCKELQFALFGELASGNSTYRQLTNVVDRSSRKHGMFGPTYALIEQAVLWHDQASFLEIMLAELNVLQGPVAEWPAGLSQSDAARSRSAPFLVSRFWPMLTPDTVSAASRCSALIRRALLAEGAIIAHTRGYAATESWARQIRDQRTGDAVRVLLETDRTVVLWYEASAPFTSESGTVSRRNVGDPLDCVRVRAGVE
jgi:hypothetical protein